MEEKKMLIRIAEMYYQENKTQGEISKSLNIHRTTISRLLKRIREENIVNISINYEVSKTYQLESRLQETFQLKKAIVVPVAPGMKESNKIAQLGEAASEYLTDILRDNMIIGFSWGKNMSSLVNAIKAPKSECHQITCVPLIGGPSGRLSSDYHVNTITYQAAKKIGAKALLIDAPAIPETSELKESLLANEYNQVLSQMWKRLDVAVLGIGSPNISGNERWAQFYGERVLDIQQEGKVAGDVVSRFFNVKGEPIESELNDRVIGIAFEDLKKTEIRIGMIETQEKVDAVIGAMRGKCINVLITSEDVAKAILDSDA